MTEFSLDLNEDQLQIQKWVHDFAADVIRPAGPEWDEREETPWPIIEEAFRDQKVAPHDVPDLLPAVRTLRQALREGNRNSLP